MSGFDLEAMMLSAHWSDRFFNFDDINYSDRYDGEEVLRDDAEHFLKLNPDCPFDADWLVRDYLRRL